MPMLTGTLITAAGFLPIGWRSLRGRVHVRDLCRHHCRTGDLLAGVGLLRALPRCHAAAHQPHAAPGEGAHELFDTPFYSRFRKAVNWCVRHRWITIGVTCSPFVLGVVGMGRVQQQFFPDSSRPRSWSTCGCPRDRHSARRGWLGASRSAWRRNPALPASPHGSARRASLLPAARPDLPAATSARPSCCRPTCAAREACAEGCRPCSPPSSRGARPRQAVAQRPACAVSGAVPRGRADMWPRCEPGPTRPRPSCCVPTQHARRQRQLEREQVKVLRLSRSTRTRRAYWVSRARASHRPPGPILSGTTVGQFREGDKLIDIVLAPARRRAQCHHRPRHGLPAHGVGRSRSRCPRSPGGTYGSQGVMWREGRKFAITVQGEVVDGVQGPTVTAQVWPDLAEASCPHACGLRHRGRRGCRGK
jgi:multidrug efflux pump